VLAYTLSASGMRGGVGSEGQNGTLLDQGRVQYVKFPPDFFFNFASVFVVIHEAVRLWISRLVG
jgi:hypothetical protein